MPQTHEVSSLIKELDHFYELVNISTGEVIGSPAATPGGTTDPVHNTITDEPAVVESQAKVSESSPPVVNGIMASDEDEEEQSVEETTPPLIKSHESTTPDIVPTKGQNEFHSLSH